MRWERVVGWDDDKGLRMDSRGANPDNNNPVNNENATWSPREKQSTLAHGISGLSENYNHMTDPHTPHTAPLTPNV